MIDLWKDFFCAFDYALVVAGIQITVVNVNAMMATPSNLWDDELDAVQDPNLLNERNPLLIDRTTPMIAIFNMIGFKTVKKLNCPAALIGFME